MSSLWEHADAGVEWMIDVATIYNYPLRISADAANSVCSD